jgi:hypothetical protein
MSQDFGLELREIFFDSKCERLRGEHKTESSFRFQKLRESIRGERERERKREKEREKEREREKDRVSE